MKLKLNLGEVALVVMPELDQSLRVDVGPEWGEGSDQDIEAHTEGQAIDEERVLQVLLHHHVSAAESACHTHTHTQAQCNLSVTVRDRTSGSPVNMALVI